MMTHISSMDSGSISGHCRCHADTDSVVVVVVVGLKSIYVFTLGENAPPNCEKMTRTKGAKSVPTRLK